MSNNPTIHSMSLFVVTHNMARMPREIQCGLVSGSGLSRISRCKGQCGDWLDNLG
jgi:hypothetical protein